MHARHIPMRSQTRVSARSGRSWFAHRVSTSFIRPSAPTGRDAPGPLREPRRSSGGGVGRRSGAPEYTASAEREGQAGWTVRLSGTNGALPSFHARDLADVEPRARRLIWGHTGATEERIRVDLQVQLPAAVHDRLFVIRELCGDLDTEREALIKELAGLGVSRLDTVRVLEMHRPASRPLTITNAELADHGLERHPQAVGIEWDDHSFAVTKLCRRHVRALRCTYGDLDPEGRNAVVYDDAVFRCDRCFEGDDQ